LRVSNDSLIVKAFLLLLVLNPFQFQFTAPVNAPLNIRAGIHNFLIKEIDVFYSIPFLQQTNAAFVMGAIVIVFHEFSGPLNRGQGFAETSVGYERTWRAFVRAN
jgi:hypothetical protein